jgi:UDP-N-acetylglucosamine transferase subunit ALG13
MRLFVTVGNAAVHFNRLLSLVDQVLAAPEFGDVDGVCQSGTGSVRPRRLRCTPMLSRSEFDEELRRADAVVMHAGVGSLSAAIRAGHRPIVMPRRRAHNEVVNDHQFEIARELATRNLVTLVEDADALRAALLAPNPKASLEDALPAPALATVERAFERSRPRRARGATFLLGILALAAPPIDRLRIR